MAVEATPTGYSHSFDQLSQIAFEQQPFKL
jgi:hypothetical protein